jgi:hypothetical protein
MTCRLTRLALAIVALLGASVEASYAQIVIHSASDLQGVSNNMAANYVLDADVDLSSVVDFIPLGVSATAADPIPFTGTLDGAGHAITGLTQVSSGRYVGLFGLIGAGGSIKNLRVRSAAITSNYGGGSAAKGSPIPGMIGILAGENDHGSIDSVTVNGTIISTAPGSACGGVVGVNIGSITNSSAFVTLTATLQDSDNGLLDQSTQIGGIAGRNAATITNVGAAGTISVELTATVSTRAVFGAQIGGLVGLSDSGSRIAASNAGVNISAAFSGSAFATPADNPYTAYWNAIGGLVGNAPSSSTIIDSFASGFITVTDTVKPAGGLTIDAIGGLLGSGGVLVGLDGNGTYKNENPAGTPTITGSSASGSIKARDLCCAPHGASLNVGALAGQFAGTIISSYASGSVEVTGEGWNGVGGLIGQVMSGTLTDVRASGSVTSVDRGAGNDVGGLAGTTGAVITNAVSSGPVSSSLNLNLPPNTQEDSTIGGLVGFNHGVIKNALALSSVTATFAGSVSDSSSFYIDQVAGLVANNAGPISNSSARGTVSLTSTVATSNGGISTKMAGGLVGGNYVNSFGTSSISNSFATGGVSVSGVNDQLMAGALMAYNASSVSSSYALGKLSIQGGSGNTIGGLVGRNDIHGSITASYWGVNQTGLTIGVGSGTATGATSWSAAPTTMPVGFDPAIWGLAPNVDNGYPYLLWQLAFPLSFPGCSYSLDYLGQAFPSQGGTGTITVTTGSGCPWTVGALPANIRLTSDGFGSGSGIITFQVLPNVGGALSNSFIIAGQTFTIEQSAFSIPGLAVVGSLGQVASEGSWDFSLISTNLGSSAATARFSFADNNGNPLRLPLTFPQSAPATGPELASTIDRTLNPNAQIVMESTGPDSVATLVGSGQVLSNGKVSGFGIFSNPRVHWNAVVPLETRNADKYFLAFDNTAPLTTGVAVANLSGQAQNIRVIIRDDIGTEIGNPTIPLSAFGHTSFMLSDPQLGFPATNGKRGTIEFDTPPGGQLSVIGLRANGAALTTLPVLASGDKPGGAIAHVAFHGGWSSVFYLVNTGNTPAQLTLSFFDENGVPLPVPLFLPQSQTAITTAALTQTLPAGTMLEINTQAQDALAVVAGSAQMATNGVVSGFEIFRWTTFGQEASVPLETRTPNSFVLVFDDTSGLTTGVALANTSGQAVNIPATFRDDAGTQIGVPATINLAARGHTSFLLPDLYPAAARGKRGMVEFTVPPTSGVSIIGLRARSDGTLTTIPLLAK